MLYAGLIAFVGAIVLYALSAKTILELNVIPERNPLYVQLSDGGIRNTYTVKILNKRYETRSFNLAIEGLPGAKLTILGHKDDAQPVIDVVPDDLQELKAYVTVPRDALAKLDEKNSFQFVVTDIKDASKSARTTNFRKP